MKDWIMAHFVGMGLKRWGNIASGRYILTLPFNAPPALTITCRPSGWHKESCAAETGAHITVDFPR